MNADFDGDGLTFRPYDLDQMYLKEFNPYEHDQLYIKQSRATQTIQDQTKIRKRELLIKRLFNISLKQRNFNLLIKLIIQDEKACTIRNAEIRFQIYTTRALSVYQLNLSEEENNEFENRLQLDAPKILSKFVGVQELTKIIYEYSYLQPCMYCVYPKYHLHL